MKFRRIVFLLLLGLLFTNAYPVFSAADQTENTEKIPVKVLILPKFEVEKMAGDFPGEAQYYYEGYLMGGEEVEMPDDTTVYVKDGVAMYLPGMGKIDSALSTAALLSDDRFDFSNTCILSTGCAGAAAGYGVMGDVFLITAAVDYDLGHHADIRDMTGKRAETWFHDPDYDDIAVVCLNPELMDRVYALVKDIPLKTTEKTRNYMSAAFNGEEWAVRDPMVLRGTTVTSDNYWKGEYDHANAVLMTETYDCPDPFALTEMEDIAVCHAVKRSGLLDRLIILRDSVNMDVFMLGATPESLWNADPGAMVLSAEDSVEAADIFATAMENNFTVGRVIIDAVLRGELF